MASLAKRFLEQLKTKEFREYLMSTHFWGPAMNWMIPITAIMDMRKDPKIISPNMTTALFFYSGIFMRFALKVKPRNMLLFACHMTNFGAQFVQFMRYLNYAAAQKSAQAK